MQMLIDCCLHKHFIINIKLNAGIHNFKVVPAEHIILHNMSSNGVICNSEPTPSAHSTCSQLVIPGSYDLPTAQKRF